MMNKEVQELVDAAYSALMGGCFKHPDIKKSLEKALQPFLNHEVVNDCHKQ